MESDETRKKRESDLAWDNYNLSFAQRAGPLTYKNELRIIQLRKKFEAQDGKCFYCEQATWLKSSGETEEEACARLGIPLVRRRRDYLIGRLEHRAASREHLVRQVDGGGDEDENIVMACVRCNGNRNETSVEEHKAKSMERMKQILVCY